MEAKFPHNLFGALLMFLVLQAFVAYSRPVKLESPQFSTDTEGRLYIKGRTCGFPYIIGQQASHDTGETPDINQGMFYDLVDNYTFLNGTWTSFPVTWGFRSVGNYPPANLDSQVMMGAFRASFAQWQGAVPKFAFKYVHPGDAANIRILFRNFTFSPTTPYIGFGQPPPNGLLELFNHTLLWSTGSPAPKKLDLQSVIVHEIGHTLGLGHSANKDAVMYKDIDDNILRRDLTQDDIQGIQKLYA